MYATIQHTIRRTLCVRAVSNVFFHICTKPVFIKRTDGPLPSVNAILPPSPQRPLRRLLRNVRPLRPLRRLLRNVRPRQMSLVVAARRWVYHRSLLDHSARRTLDVSRIYNIQQVGNIIIIIFYYVDL